MSTTVLEIPRIEFSPDARSPLAAILSAASDAIHAIHHQNSPCVPGSTVAISRIRGTGPGVSFGALVDQLERDHPIEVRPPFEATDSIAGGVWDADEILGGNRNLAALKLVFSKGTDSLPFHSHEQSDRVIFVLFGRGFFWSSPQGIDSFDGSQIRSTPVRERDALIFTRGTVHTFSAPSEDLVLLSIHTPYIPLDDDDQYTIPSVRLTPADVTPDRPARVTIDPAWTILQPMGF